MDEKRLLIFRLGSEEYGVLVGDVSGVVRSSGKQGTLRGETGELMEIKEMNCNPAEQQDELDEYEQ